MTTFIGLTKEAALQKGKDEQIRVRISNEEGVPKMLTMDYWPNRYNLTILNGIVTAEHRG